MKLLVTGYGSTGDTQPLLALAEARRELGHTPLRLTWDELPIVLAWSPTLVPASTDWTHPDTTITGQWRLPAHPDWQPPADWTEFLAAGEPRSTSVSVGGLRAGREEAPCPLAHGVIAGRPCR